MTTIFVPVSTGPWLTVPAGSTNLPVTSATGFEVGQKIGMDIGGNFEVATVTASASRHADDAVRSGGRGRDQYQGRRQRRHDRRRHVDRGHRRTQGTRLGQAHHSVSAAPDGRGRGGFGGGSGGEVELSAPLKFDHVSGVNVSDAGTGISFSPATRFTHLSGDAVQALGSGITLDRPLAKATNSARPWSIPRPRGGLPRTAGSQSVVRDPLSTTAGSIALLDASGKVVVDAMVYGSRQSSSSANGTIASPELATLEGDQSKGGCIVVAPSSGRGGPGGALQPLARPIGAWASSRTGPTPTTTAPITNCRPPRPARPTRKLSEDARGIELGGGTWKSNQCRDPALQFR